MSVDAEQIVAMYHDRKLRLSPVHAGMQHLQDAVNGDMDLPLPELDRNERPMVANLIAQGLDQNAMRVASTLPDAQFPPLRDGVKTSEDKARSRRLAVLAWWKMNRLHLLQRKRARRLLGYACAPVVIRPDLKRGIPAWYERDPLTTYWPPDCELAPDDCIFTIPRSWRWLNTHYPDDVRALSRGPNPRPDDLFTILEYHDGDQTLLVAMGRTEDRTDGWVSASGSSGLTGRPWATLGAPVVNRTGLCMVVIPSRITLDRLAGQFDSAVPLFWNQAMLMALELVAVKRGIFPDEWIESRQNETAQVITEADGLRGERGVITGGTIKPMALNPGIQTYPTIDRIERSLRLAGGIPAEFGGESPSNIRTGRRGSQVLSSAIDYAIQEAQEILAAALEEENVRAIAVAKTYLRGERSFYVSWNGKSARVTYDPATTFETDEHTVRYSIPGASVNELVVGGGQRIGMGTLSKESWMSMDPLIDDPELEMRRISVEGYRAALMQGVQTQVAGGQIAPSDAARLIQLVNQGMPDEEALLKVQEEAQQRQSTTENPAVPGSPETMPGLAQPGVGAEAGAAIPEPGPSQQNLVTLLNSLARPQQQARVATG